MTDELSRVRERAIQNRTSRADDIATGAREMALEPTRPSGTFIAGDRVFDTISGLEGTVVATRTENLVLPAAKR